MQRIVYLVRPKRPALSQCLAGTLACVQRRVLYTGSISDIDLWDGGVLTRIGFLCRTHPVPELPWPPSGGTVLSRCSPDANNPASRWLKPWSARSGAPGDDEVKTHVTLTVAGHCPPLAPADAVSYTFETFGILHLEPLRGGPRLNK